MSIIREQLAAPRRHRLWTRIQQSQLNWAGVLLRVITILGKFILIAYITKYLSLDDLGLYGLMVTTLVLALYLLGIEFYAYSSREILATTPLQRPFLLQNQAVLHLTIYTFALPALLIVFAAGFLPWHYAPYFYGILVASHIAQEMQRLLITLSQTFAAYVVLTIAHGAWVYPVIMMGVAFPLLRTLDVVLAMWMLFACCAVAVGAVRLSRIGALHLSRRRPDVLWIRRGVRVAVSFLIIALAYRVIELSDRYFVQFYWDAAQVGVYTFYGSMAATLLDFVATGVVAVTYPLMVSSYQNGDLVQYRLYRRRMARQTLLVSALLLPLFAIGIHVLLYLLQRPELESNIQIYYLLLLSSFLLAISLTPHYELFAGKHDRALLVSVCAAVVVNLLLNFLWIPTFGIVGAAWATLISFGCVAGLKTFFAVRTRSGQSRYAQ